MSEQVAIVGSGLVGSAWALVFARAGWHVRLYDQEASQLTAAEARIADNAGEMVRHDLLDDAPSVLGRIESRARLEDALEGVSYVQESVFENADVKRAFYRRLDAVAGSRTIIGSSSSGIPASVFTEGLACAPRCLIAHPINPPYVIPLVEICPTPWTDPSVVDRVWSLMSDAGMTPVRVTREIDGFIANRLQAALLWEAFRLLEGGYASAQDIDRTISAGLGRRWAFIGPFETIDLNAPRGLADYAARLGPGFFEFVKQGEPAQPWSDDVIAKAHDECRSRVEESELPARQAWRDRRLMALAAHLTRARTKIGS
ncbi:MAG: 3-hydroxyacyl-CoA dehydrogenase [Acidobacteria bacterium]|nr:3-hydroxyacyl-CoA dehydrogenase [Acidobacteriota bacterium]